MAIYLAKRLIGACIVLWAVITITFGLMHAIPGGPFTQEKKLPPAVMATVEARYHLDEPLWDQYVDYVRHAAVLDLGPSYKYPGKTVNDIIAETLPVSAELGLISLLLAIGAGILAGMAAAWYKNTWVDYGMMIGATLGVSVPSFILAAVLIQLFAFTWPVLPAALWKGPAYVILPALALAAQPTAFYHAFDAVEPGRCLGTRLYTDGPFAGDWSLVFIVPPCPAQCPLACRQLYRPLGGGLDDRELYRRDDFCHSRLGASFCYQYL